MMTPAGKTFVKNWTVYRSRFIDPVRIRAGVQFWQANRRALGVPSSSSACPPRSSSASSAWKLSTVATWATSA
ncbi:hypothetical protein J4714_14085 [Staphylococcus epidermidis]|nr:hypothetical protein [Staphylococcus epidermidis]